MSGRPPILKDPLATAERVAMEILDLDRSRRPEELAKVVRVFYALALRKGRTNGEANFFVREMRRLIDEAIEEIVARGGGKGGQA